MAIEWIKPTGKTQKDIDSDTVVAETERSVQEAQKFLNETDYRVIKAIETLLAERGMVSEETLQQREDARGTIRRADRIVTNR